MTDYFELQNVYTPRFIFNCLAVMVYGVLLRKCFFQVLGYEQSLMFYKGRQNIYYKFEPACLTLEVRSIIILLFVKDMKANACVSFMGVCIV